MQQKIGVKQNRSVGFSPLQHPNALAFSHTTGCSALKRHKCRYSFDIQRVLSCSSRFLLRGFGLETHHVVSYNSPRKAFASSAGVNDANSASASRCNRCNPSSFPRNAAEMGCGQHRRCEIFVESESNKPKAPSGRNIPLLRSLDILWMRLLQRCRADGTGLWGQFRVGVEVTRLKLKFIKRA